MPISNKQQTNKMNEKTQEQQYATMQPQQPVQYQGNMGQEGMMADPLDCNVNDIDTSYPVIPATHYDMQLGECTLKENKKATGQNLVVPHKLMANAQDIKGNAVNKGYTITSYISIQPQEKKDGTWTTIDDVKREVAKVAKAAGVNATVKQIIMTPSLLNGKIVKANVGISKETDDFPASNKIKGYAV